MQASIKNNGKSPDRILSEVSTLMRVAPYKIGNMAVLFFKDNIRSRQGFLDVSIDGWQETRSGAIQRPGSKLLIYKGNLLRGITQQVNGMRVQVYVVGVAAKYAELHNTGGIIAVTPKMRAYFWAKHYEASKKVRHKKDGITLSKDSIGNYQAAEFYKHLALADKITIPKRKFIGNSLRLNQAINTFLTDELTKIFNK